MDYKKLRDTRNSSNPFAQRLGIFVEEIGPGYARAVKDITAEDANPVGVATGAATSPWQTRPAAPPWPPTDIMP